nr:MAG TPA: hypothetical protein [Caudoviricetes sp.]
MVYIYINNLSTERVIIKHECICGCRLACMTLVIKSC